MNDDIDALSLDERVEIIAGVADEILNPGDPDQPGNGFVVIVGPFGTNNTTMASNFQTETLVAMFRELADRLEAGKLTTSPAIHPEPHDVAAPVEGAAD